MFMKIVFWGQAGQPARVQALSKLLVEAGHEVMALKRMREADVVHVQGWNVGILAGVVMAAASEATLVWTIDSLPAWPRWAVRCVVRSAARILDVITVTRRDVQYHLLDVAGVRAVYIPDGYTPAATQTLSPRRWGVWPGRYCVATVGSEIQEQFVRAAYEKSGSKRTLVVLPPDMSSRVTAALFRDAAAILLFGANDTAETVLQAMATGKQIVAAAWPLYEEILGVTARYVRMGDEEEFERVIREVLKSQAPTSAPSMRGASKATARRAEKHFRWERILADYLPLYRTSGRLVPLDSATLYQQADVAEWHTRTA